MGTMGLGDVELDTVNSPSLTVFRKQGVFLVKKLFHSFGI